MIQVKIGDLFDSTAQTIVNTVNCVGIMGKGVALEAKKRFPEMFRDYVARCERGEVRLGQPYLFRYLAPPWILNFPTKGHWRSVTRLDDIIHGLEYLESHYEEWGITSLAVPPLGCGNGQLEWRIVGPTLYRYLDRLNIPIELYAPHGAPHEELIPDFLDPSTHNGIRVDDMPDPQWIRPEWVVIAEIVKRIDEQPYHWPVGRTLLQKIAYVATREGLDTGLTFERGSYGPYAPGVKRLISRLVNNGLITEQPSANLIAIRPGTTYEAARVAYAADIEWWEPLIERLVDLFIRIDLGQAEVITTTMYASDELARRGEPPSERQVLDAVMEWKRRRNPPMHELEVAETIRDLAALGWLKVTPSIDLPLGSDTYAFA
jgi:O-acetyl-ADP-ribose deacetylase (regulator of RNase III)